MFEIKKIILLLLVCCYAAYAMGQFRHFDYLGAGHTNELVVSTSSSSSTATGQQTIDGFPIGNPEQLKDASRFLAQATLGADYATIEMAAAMGYTAWLEEQFNLPPSYILDEFKEQAIAFGKSIHKPVSYTFFRTGWLSTQLTAPDLLRQRLALALSEIFVVSTTSDFSRTFGQMPTRYFDVLVDQAFNNYYDLLTDITLSPMMGRYLTYHNNPKEDTILMIQPDENYAREIMQLFSIGLWELNPNGTRKLDSMGMFIPTYTNTDIKEFAQVFTGFVDPPVEILPGNWEPGDGEARQVETISLPMWMAEDRHDPGEKHLLNGVVLPANQPGMVDVAQTLEHLATHPNTAPFFSKALIQFLTTSNPSTTYVEDVAAEFDPFAPNNLEELIKTILLHEEVRAPVTDTYTVGKLREPFMRFFNLLKAFPFSPYNDLGDYGDQFWRFNYVSGQSPLGSGSVFNFFRPDYQPPGLITENYLVAPEFQILTATNCIGLINHLEERLYKEEALPGFQEEFIYTRTDEHPEPYQFDFSKEMALLSDPVALVDRLDILLANGLLEEDTKAVIVTAISQLEEETEKIRMALYLILISPEYVILK